MSIHISTSVAKNLVQARELQPVREKNRGNISSPKASEGLNDKVSLSSSSRDLMEHTGITEQTTSPRDLRSERIERLKHEIQSGTYTPNPERIARAMLAVHRDALI